MYNLTKKHNLNLSNDSKCKKFFLIIFSSTFYFVGVVIRGEDVVKFGLLEEENNSQLEIRIRGIQIIISSLLCFFTIRLNIYRHQKLSLIVISIFLAFIITLELSKSSNVKNKILSILICVMSCLSRAFMDVTEKYLFDYDYMNILSVLIYEGLIGLLFLIIYFISSKTYQKQGNDLIKAMSELDWSFAIFLLLVVLYIIISGFRNVYRVKTNKYYSPMSRALFESTLDPFLFIYNFLTQNNNEAIKQLKWIYFSLVVFSLTVISFFSLVYNDFIILYCCGLEHNTYIKIDRRLNLDNTSSSETQENISIGDNLRVTIDINSNSTESVEMKSLN